MKHFLLPLIIGVSGFAIALAIMFWGGQLVSSAQIEASDMFMVRANEPRLGARRASSEIVLVLFDKKSADQLGYVHSYANDAELYRNLVAQGARVVFDTRMIAAGTREVFAEVSPLLDEMLAIDAHGRVMRDVWLTSALQTEHKSRFAQLLTQNIINAHPHEYPSVTSRLYPLAHFDSNGVHETAPLAICRRVWDLPSISSAEVGEELRRCGVMSKWHEFAPQMVPKTDVARSDLNDKIVLVGFSADIDPTSDTYTVPSLLGKAAAAEVVACAAQTILEGAHMRLLPMPIALGLAGLLIVGVGLVAGLAKPIEAVLGVLLAIVGYFVFAVLAYRNGWYADFLVTPAVAAATSIPCGAASAWLNLRARQRVVDLFGRYVPRAIVNQLIQRPMLESLTLGGVKREVTVMFADIRGFTDFSQDLAPEEVVRELNSLLEIMVACTFENEGTLDKFIGDAILVLFNAPLDQPDHTERAARTAVSIQQRLKGHASGLHVGIGLHCGMAVVGNIGSPQRMEYTAIGSTVNIASRLCDLARPGDVVVSQAVLERLPKTFEVHAIGDVNVKGIKAAMHVSRINPALPSSESAASGDQ